MPRVQNNLKPKKNPSEEKLRATPFSSVAELDTEAKAIRLSVWRKFHEAQIIHELLSKPEYRFVQDEWREGLTAVLDEGDPTTQMYRIYSVGKGIQVKLNKSFTATLGEQEVKFFEGVLRAGIDSFGTLYMRGKGLIPAERGSVDPTGVQSPLPTQPKKRSQKRGR